MIQSKTVDDTIKAQIQRLIERTNLEIQNLESQLHDAHDIDYVEFTQTQARVSRTKIHLSRTERFGPSPVTVKLAVRGSLTQALPAFEETATVFYLDLDDLLRRPTPYETR